MAGTKADTKSDDGPPAGGLRYLLRRREDPYAGADLDLARRMAAALYVIGAAAVLVILPLAPPTKAIGGAGWAVGIAVVLCCFAGAARLRRAPARVSVNQLLFMSYSTLVLIGSLEWLAGGHETPYHQLYMIGILWTAATHPPRRVFLYLVAFVAAMFSSFIYGPASSSDVGDAGLQTFMLVGMGALSCVMIDRIRGQRVTLRAEGDAERHRAVTDPLTGLTNRRGLMADLELGASAASGDQPLLLALFDLDGFKAYNDSYGHPAGDALLQRLARSLADSVGARGTAYRMGGDEFCVLAMVAGDDPAALAGSWRAALTEDGDGFAITASAGWIVMPSEAVTPADALRLADRRMYAAKSLGRTSAGRQSVDVLLRVLEEFDETLPEHVGQVAQLSEAVGRAYGVPADELATLRAAAALHDVGKVALPESILGKPGPLDEPEWELVRRHTQAAERILGAAPALAPAAPLVRAIHERVDGAGYPDGLRGDAIPLGSRIVAVCEAYDAMTSDRPYRAAMTHDAALDELRRCAGTQFDPRVVEVFVRVVEKHEARAAA